MTDREHKVVEIFADKLELARTVEAELLKDTEELLTLLGATYVRVIEATDNGVADLLVCYKGRFIACELKSATGKPSMAQQKFIVKVINSGGSAGVCSTLLEVLKLLLE